jgi:hypothetical protein
MSTLEELMKVRLLGELLTRIEVILTVMKAGRRQAAVRLYDELTNNIRRYDRVMEEDSQAVRLIAMLSFVNDPVMEEATLQFAQQKLSRLRRQYEFKSSLQKLF